MIDGYRIVEFSLWCVRVWYTGYTGKKLIILHLKVIKISLVFCGKFKDNKTDCAMMRLSTINYMNILICTDKIYKMYC